jgi:hypothetical protein
MFSIIGYLLSTWWIDLKQEALGFPPTLVFSSSLVIYLNLDV